MNFNKEIKKSINILNKGGIILYPTDTVWGIGCDATNDSAVKNIIKLKKRNISKGMIILIDSIEKLNYLVSLTKETENIIINIIKNQKKPITFIYENPKKVSNYLFNKDGTLAIRITNDSFCKTLINVFNKPIVSTSANISGDITPISFSDINTFILNKVDYIVNLQKDYLSNNVSTILKINKNGEIKILRC